jgi:hypothetical protein
LTNFPVILKPKPNKSFGLQKKTQLKVLQVFFMFFAKKKKKQKEKKIFF